MMPSRRAMLQLSAAVLPALALGCGRSFDLNLYLNPKIDSRVRLLLEI